MRKFFKLILLIILLGLPQDSKGMDTEFLLARTGESNKEYARCFSKKSIIKYKGDIVYSEDTYDNLRDNIYSRLEFLRTVDKDYNQSQASSSVSGVKKSYPNFMTVILAATGKNKHNNFKRIFWNLHGENKNGKYTFYSEPDTSKFIVFYSNKNSGIKKVYDNTLLVRLNDLGIEGNEEISERVTSSAAPSHTEALSISGILSLNSNTFSDMLSKNYELMYYEIHFISCLDACDKCPKIIYSNINKLKEHFKNEKLFIFYHAQGHYEPNKEEIIPYTLKFKVNKKWKYIPGKMATYQYIHIKKEDDCPAKQWQKYNLRGSDKKPCLFKSIPNFYISFIYDLENSDSDREKAARKIIIKEEI